MIFLHTDYGRNFVRERLEKELSAVFVGDVRVGGLHGSLLSEFSLSKISIEDAQGEVAVSVGIVKVDYSISQLVYKTIKIDSLQLGEVQLHGVRNAQGAINLAELIKPSEDDEDDEPSEDTSPSPWSVLAPNIVLRNSSASFRDGPLNSGLQEFSLEASATFKKGILKAELATLTAQVVPPSLEVEPAGTNRGIPLSLQGILETGNERVSVESLELTLGDASVSLPNLLLRNDGQTKAAAQITLPVSMVRLFDPTTALLADVQLSLRAERGDTSQPIVLQAEGTLGDSPLTLSGSIAPEEESIAIQLKASKLNGQALWQGAVDSNIDIDIKAKAVGVSVETMRASVAVAISGKADKAELGVLNLNATIEKGIASAEIETPEDNQWIAAKAKIRIADLEILESELHVDHPKVQLLARGYSDARGDLKLDATASGPLSAIQVEGKIASKRFTAEGNRVRGLAASWKATLSDGNYSGSANLVTSSVSSGGTPYGSAKLTVHTLKPNKFGVHLVSRGPKRSHYVNLKSKVALEDYGTVVDINQVKLAAQGLSFRGNGGSITIGADKNLIFRNIALKSKVGHINLHGNVKVDRGLSKGNIELVADDVDFEGISKALALDPPIRGTGSLRAKMRKASGKRALGTVHLEFDEVRSGKQVPPSSGVVDLRLDHRDLTANATLKSRGVGTIALEAAARGPRNPLALPGWIRLGEKALVSAKVKSSALNMAGLSHLSKDLPTAGKITLDGEIGAAGSLASLQIETKDIVHPKAVEPVNSSVRVTLNGTRVELAGKAGIKKRLASTIAAVVELPGPLLSPSTMGRLTQDNLLEARLRVNHVDLFWWDKILELGFEPVDAEADIDVVVAQGARRATATIRATQKALNAQRKPEVRSSEVIAVLEPDSIALKVSAALGKREAVRGSITLDQGWTLLASGDPKVLDKTTVAGDIKVLGVPLALLQTVLAPQDEDTDLPEGSLLASAAVSGTLANPIAMIDAHTEGGIVAGIEFVDLRVKARYSEFHVEASLTGAQKAGGTLHLDSDIHLGPSPRAKTTLDAKNWDLGFLKNLAPDRSIGGLFSAKINVKGPLEKPVIEGSAQIKKGSLHPGAPLNGMRNLDIELGLTPSKLTIKGVGNSGRGDLLIRGSVAMEDLLPKSMKLDLALTQVPVEAGPLSVFIDTKTTLRGKSRGPDWRFDIDIGKTIINVPGGLSRELHPDSIPDDIIFVDSIQVAPPALVAALVSSPAAVIDVYVRAPETIEVRGEPVRTLVDVDLHARLSSDLLLEGTVATRGGWIELFGRRYELRRGDVAFGGSTDPSLNIELTHDFSASTLTVGVTGTGSAPELDLRSDPARYDDAELLSFVLGASPDEDGSKEQSAKGRATGVASNYLAGQLQSVVRDVIPIDVLKIDISDDEAAAEKLTLGKWLTDKIFLAYRRRFEAQDLENANEAVMEYRFRKRWLLELSYGDEGTGGADVLWIRRF